MKDTLVVIFENRKNGFRQDIEIPLYITANELIGSLNEACSSPAYGCTYVGRYVKF